MVNWRIVERPAFEVVGKKTWIAGAGDNGAFGRFWEQCGRSGLFTIFKDLSGFQAGPQTGGVTLGISCVDKDPNNRAFYYLIGIERPVGEIPGDLEIYLVPASHWAIFECHGPLPGAIVEAEMYAFMQWLPTSGYVHAHAPEMEVYSSASGGSDDPDHYCEFWLPVVKKAH